MKNGDNFKFDVTVATNEVTGKVLSVYFQVRSSKVAKTKECKEGVALADYDRHGRLVGVELLAPCKIGVLDKIAEQKPARDFIRESVPRGMLVNA